MWIKYKLTFFLSLLVFSCSFLSPAWLLLTLTSLLYGAQKKRQSTVSYLLLFVIKTLHLPSFFRRKQKYVCIYDIFLSHGLVLNGQDWNQDFMPLLLSPLHEARTLRSGTTFLPSQSTELQRGTGDGGWLETDVHLQTVSTRGLSSLEPIRL